VIRIKSKNSITNLLKFFDILAQIEIDGDGTRSSFNHRHYDLDTGETMHPVAAMKIEHGRKPVEMREINRIDDWSEYTQKEFTLAAIHPDIHKLLDTPAVAQMMWREFSIAKIFNYEIDENNKPSLPECSDNLYIMPKSLEIISFEETKTQIIRKMHNMVDAGLVKVGQYRIVMPYLTPNDDDGKLSYRGGFVINFVKEVDIDDRCRIKNLLDQTFFRGKPDPTSPDKRIPHMMRCSWLKRGGVRYQNRPNTVSQIQQPPRMAKAPVTEMKERELMSNFRPRVTKGEKEKQESEQQTKEKEEKEQKEQKEQKDKEKEQKEQKDKERKEKEKKERMQKEKARLEREKRLEQEDDEEDEEEEKEEKEAAKVESLPVAPRRMRTLPVRSANSGPKIPSRTIWQALEEPTEEAEEAEEAEEPSEVRTPVSAKELRSKPRTGKKLTKKPKAAASIADDWTGEEEVPPEP
jgi:hypothetical protein